MRKLTSVAITALLVSAYPVLAQSAIDNFTPVNDADIAAPAGDDWLTYLGNYNGWSYSTLDQINVGNVKNLQLVWSRAIDPGSVESTPLERNGVIFLGNANDVIQAIDAKDGSLIWEYRRQLPDLDTVINALGENKRSIALYGDKVVFTSFDNFIVALDAKTGQLAWETDRGQGDEGITNSTGPIVANGVVIAGSTCQYSPFGCYTTGHDVANGEELWRNTFIPRPGEEGDDTWGAPFESRWVTGAWGPITYDADLDLAFYGSTAVSPASEVQRNGEGMSLYGTNTRFAVRPKTGEIVWRHQVLPRDNWDQECTWEAIIVDSPINPKADAEGMIQVGNVSGETRKVQTGVPCKTGIAWTLDAATGEFLWAKATNTQNLVASIDKEGIVTVNEDVVLSDITKTYDACPTFLGGRDWPSSAYSPKLNAFFMPLNNVCMDIKAKESEPVAAEGGSYNVDFSMKLAPGKTNYGRIDAVSVETGETLWSYEQKAPLYAPVTATAGDLLLSAGGSDRYIRALNQNDGSVLWEARLTGQVNGKPITFAVDGKQYVAITGGGSLVAGLFAPMVPDVDAVTGSNGIFVFALPD